MKCLYFGGSFNPIGIHHLIMAQAACEHGEYDKVIFVPCYEPPHKGSLASYYHRDKMIRLAIEGDSRFDISTIEQCLHEKTGRPSYTYDTVQAVRRNEEKVHLLVGTDSLVSLRTWYNFEKLIQDVVFVEVARPGYDFSKEISANIIRVSLPHIELSSTYIRNRIKDGKDIRYFVPPGVAEYIHSNFVF